jgi:hypothetical protein
MQTTLRNKVLKGYFIKPTSFRSFSGAAAIKDNFQAAWLRSQQGRIVNKKEPKDKQEYGSGYIQRNNKRMTKGYTHPYHSASHPLLHTSIKNTFDVISNLVGPEQVSPHYESLSRSRRGLIFSFVYIAAITNIARLGGWDNNEWIRGLVFHAEYLLGLYIGYIELRHFTFLPGPKFTIFYDVYSRYELSQLASQWNDTAEELQQTAYQNSRQQVEYMRIHNEYSFIKKRSLINFLTNERLNLEKHFHDRTVTMLNTISSYETQNLKNKLNTIAQQSFAATLERVNNDHDGAIKEQAFNAALEGIKVGKMTFENDPVMPILHEEINERTKDLRDLTPEQESAMLSLKTDQRHSVVQMDNAAKDAYLSAVPHITSQGLKAHDKFLRFATYLTNINKKD